MQILSLFPECSIAVTTRDDGGIVSLTQFQDLLAQAGIKTHAVVIPTHTHATTIAPIKLPVPLEQKELYADGLMTEERHVVLAHRLGDCCPIVIIDRKKKAIMTLHAGWRGMTLGIVGMGILTMQATYHSHVDDLWVWIGPCIQKDSYVNRDVPVQAQFYPWKSHIHVREDGYHVDLPGFVFDEVHRLGVDETHIINDGRDTYKERDIFFSHKRARDEQNIGDDQRFVVAAWIV